MSKIADVTFDANAVMISGDLDFDNVVTIYDDITQHFSEYTNVIIDFSGVTSSNSAGIALIVELIKYAKLQDKSIEFKSLSDDIHSLAIVSGLDQLISK